MPRTSSSNVPVTSVAVTEYSQDVPDALNMSDVILLANMRAWLCYQPLEKTQLKPTASTAKAGNQPSLALRSCLSNVPVFTT